MAASQVLSIFVHGTKIIIACRNRIYVPSDFVSELSLVCQNADEVGEHKMNLDETEDLFETSLEASSIGSFQDITSTTSNDAMDNVQPKTSQLTMVYKYKYHALAYCLQGNYLYSLHIKNSTCTDPGKSNSSISDVFFIECCDITDFSCVSACVSTFDTLSNERSEHFWLDAISANSIEKDFIDNNFSSTSHIYEHLNKLVFLFVLCQKKNVKVLLIQDEAPRKEVIMKENIHLKVEPKYQHPVFLSMYRNKKSALLETTEGNNDVLEDIENILSTQLADISNLSSAFNPSNIRQVFMQDKVGKNCIIVLFADGNMIRYRKAGKELHKTRLLQKNIVTCSFGAHNELLALSNSGILYKCSDIHSYFDNLGANKEIESCDIVQRIFDVTDLLEVINLHKLKQQEMVSQLQIFSSILKETDTTKAIEFKTYVETYSNASNELKNRLTLEVGHLDNPKFLSKYWKIVITIENSTDIGRAFEQHIVKFPIEYISGYILISNVDFPDEITLSCLPISISVQFMLEVPTKTWTKQLKTPIIYHNKLSSIDFVRLKSTVHSEINHTINQNKPNIWQGIFPVNKVQVHTQHDDFESFLTELNKSRPVHPVFHQEEILVHPEENQLQHMYLFSIDLDISRLESLSTRYQFFFELKRVVEKSLERKLLIYVMQVMLFYEPFSIEVKVSETHGGNQMIKLSFSGIANGPCIRKFKYDLLSGLGVNLEIQLKEPRNVIIPFEIAVLVDSFKKQLETLDIVESPEAIAKYRKILIHWRKTLNNVICSLYKSK